MSETDMNIAAGTAGNVGDSSSTLAEKILKTISFREGAFIFGIIGGVGLYYFGQQPLAVLLVLICTMIAAYRKVPTWHRALWTILDQRLPIAVSEGPRGQIPILGSVILVNTRQRTETLSYEKFVAKDGIPFAFTLFIVWRKAKQEDEENWTWYKPWSWGPMLLAVTDLEPGAAKEMVRNFGTNRAESEIVEYNHNQILGFSIQEIEELFEQGLDTQKTVPKITKADSEKAGSVRNLIAEKVKDAMNNRLNKNGIVITEVAFEDFNLPAEMLQYIQDILRTKFEKASEMIDIKVDMKRVLMLMEQAKESGLILDFITAYKIMRGLDINEIAAKHGGQIGRFLQQLIDKGDNLPEIVKSQLQIIK